MSHDDILNVKSTTEMVSPKIKREKFSIFGKRLIGRALEFDDKKIATSTKIEQDFRISKKSKKEITFCPDFTSTPTYKIPKTSTPVKIANSIQCSKKSKDCRCYCNSTFKEGIDVSLAIFGDRYTKKQYYFHDRLYHKVKTIKKTTYVTRERQVYHRSKEVVVQNKNNYIVKTKPWDQTQNNLLKFNTYDFYYTEKNFKEFKLKLIKKSLKNKKLKRLVLNCEV
ncbi:unnamed protein product [Brachionus calyciflorus]|uniref:Uncharacterized protein n=1 Tax=Brachionus calyciflorus TaxID=104777 RepID=A0A814D5V9_9BILA|nr:unnamed protein product [Brachionus calyciflorus]